MKARSQMHVLTPVLALAMTLGLGALASADDAHDHDQGGMSATLQVTFGSSPHWQSVHGTHVKEIREGERPDYDMFKYGGKYYVHNNDGWYMSRRGRGQFNRIDEHAVPDELGKVPRDHWRHYPEGWTDRSDQGKGKGKGHSKDHGNHQDNGNH